MIVTEIIRKLEQGRTEPYLCRAENGVHYVVKGRSATTKGLISEYICAKIGQRFGLPVPECELMELPEELLEYNPEYSADLGPGPVFGSRYVEQVQEVNREIVKELSADLLRDLWVFDYWVRNDDRNFTSKGGNPNLFYRQSDKRVVVVDHNLAFDDEFNVADFKRLHVGVNAGPIRGLAGLEYSDYKDRMVHAMENFDGYCHNLPPAWLAEGADGRAWVEKIHMQLSEFKEDLFWEALK